MATIEDFKTWFARDLGNAIHHKVEIVTQPSGWFEHEPQRAADEPAAEKRRLVIRVYTKTNSYAISAVENASGHTYLGCIASSRKPRAGEDWTRGNDLPDGPLDQETWQRILARIVSYEMVQVQHNVMTREWTGEVPEPAKASADETPREAVRPRVPRRPPETTGFDD